MAHLGLRASFTLRLLRNTLYPVQEVHGATLKVKLES
jgi:hypothetical protein